MGVSPGPQDDPDLRELCRAWENWSRQLAQAVSSGEDLPPPPEAPPRCGVLMRRLLSAATGAAAVLARSGMDSHGLRGLCGSLEEELGRARAEAQHFRERAERLEERRDADPRSCDTCTKAQRRVAELAEEAEQLRAALAEAETRRRRDVEEAWELAVKAEQRRQQVLDILGQLVQEERTAPVALRALSAKPHRPQEAPQLPRGGSQATRIQETATPKPRGAVSPQLPPEALGGQGRESHRSLQPDQEEGQHLDSAEWEDHGPDGRDPHSPDVWGSTRQLEAEVLRLCRSLGSPSEASLLRGNGRWPQEPSSRTRSPRDGSPARDSQDGVIQNPEPQQRPSAFQPG